MLKRLRDRRKSSQNVNKEKVRVVEGKLEGIMDKANGIVGNFKSEPIVWNEKKPVHVPHAIKLERSSLEPSMSKISSKEAE